VPGERLSQAIETTCFRVAQEALANVARHARARTFTVKLAGSDHGLLFVVSDDGAGFDAVAARRRAVSGSSLGLLGLEERVHLVGGVFDVESSLGRGTVLRARLPLAPDPALRDPARQSSPP
jgi:signal transduction histidine kinase